MSIKAFKISLTKLNLKINYLKFKMKKCKEILNKIKINNFIDKNN